MPPGPRSRSPIMAAGATSSSGRAHAKLTAERWDGRGDDAITKCHRERHRSKDRHLPRQPTEWSADIYRANEAARLTARRQ